MATYILLLFLSLLFTDSTISSSNVPRCIDSEREALLEFKRSVTDYPNSLSSWTGLDCCSWLGVTCHNLSSNVQELNLDTSNREDGETDDLLYRFNATISPWLFNLSRLEVLSMSECGFLGTIPNMFNKLNFLTTLDLSDSSFTSSFPDSLCNLTSLGFLDFTSSGLEGFLPDCIGNMSSLARLRLGNNNLSGEIPTGLGFLKTLAYLDLSYSYYNSPIPSSFGQLSELYYIDLSYNHVSGSIPSTLWNLTNLKKFIVTSNNLSGEITDSFFMGLKSLTWLALYGNQDLVFNVSSEWNPPSQIKYLDFSKLVGTRFPPWLRNLRSLAYLFMENVNISDIFPAWFPTISPNLTSIDLADNFLTGPLPLFGAVNHTNTHLQSIVLSGNKISGTILEDLCNLRSLTILSLANNQITGKIPACLGSMRFLKVLDLANNSFSGQLPGELGSLYKLNLLHLNGNNFSGEIPPSFNELGWLRTIDLGKNRFQGLIPEWIGKNATTLQYLRLQSNNFSGEIPASLCELAELRILNLANNNLSGTIPPCLGNLSAMMLEEFMEPFHVLGFVDTIGYNFKGIEIDYTRNLKYAKFFSLSGNKLQGQIPDELMNLKGLQSLNLSNNMLTGRIPQKIDNLSDLEALDLSINQLSGTIPPGLVNIDTLAYLNLSFNNLEGRIPSGGHFNTLLNQSVFEGNSGLCGKLVMKKCAGDREEDSGASNKQNDNASGEKSDDGNVFELSWIFAGIGPGFAVGFLAVICSLYFNDPWRIAYFGFVDYAYNRVWVTYAIRCSRIRRG